MFGVNVKNYENSKKSFITMKIDNIDMAEKDIRIVNHEGYYINNMNN